MPNQPAFNVNNSNAGQDNFAVGSLVTVNFAVERFDQGNDFDNTNMVFTAPVTGKYLLTYTLRLGAIDDASEYYLTRINTIIVIIQCCGILMSFLVTKIMFL